MVALLQVILLLYQWPFRIMTNWRPRRHSRRSLLREPGLGCRGTVLLSIRYHCRVVSMKFHYCHQATYEVPNNRMNPTEILDLRSRLVFHKIAIGRKANVKSQSVVTAACSYEVPRTTADETHFPS